MVDDTSHVYLIDGSGFIFRAYHVLPALTRKSDGLPVGAVYGFCAMLFRLLEESKGADQPTHIAVVLDHPSKTFRSDLYPEYKAHRPETPEDLKPQFSIIRDAVKAFNLPCVEMEGFEADDLIVTYAVEAERLGAKVSIISSDKDLMQIVSGKIEMIDTMKNKKFGVAEVVEKFGVGPDKVIDVQSLAGDSVDNVPGVPGIGIKTAAQLINEYGSLEELLDRAEEIKQPKRRQNLVEFADAARMSKLLVTLKQDVPVEIPLDALAVEEPMPAKLISFLRGMEFNTLTKRIANAMGVDDVDAIEPADVARGERGGDASTSVATQETTGKGGGARCRCRCRWYLRPD